MPQFHSQAADEQGAPLSEFARGYIMALYFTETGEGEQPSSEASLAPSALERIRQDCMAFQRANRSLVNAARRRPGYSAERAGHDFWLTRNGHGAGFWDRDELKACGRRRKLELGDLLTEASEKFGETWVTEGDDGLIYLD